MNESPGVHLHRLDRGKVNKSNKVNKSLSVMKILVINESSTSRALGYYMALFRLNRRYYYAALSTLDNSVISIESEYKTKKAAFAALGITA